MKPYILLPLVLLLFNLNSISQDFKETNLNTKIESVRVFTQGAQITRTATTTLPAGKTSLVIRSLSPYIDGNSIQVKGLGSFTLLSVNHRFNFLGEQKKDATIDSLQGLIKQLNVKINEEESRLFVMEAKQKLLEGNKTIAGTESGLTYEQLSKVVSYYTEEMMNIRKVQIKAKEQLETLNKERNNLQNQINQINRQNETPAGEIVVRIDAKTGGKATFNVSYFTQNAGWFPKYDIRVEDIASPVRLDYKAEVYQNTQEDWNNVMLSLSNANPNQSGVAPTLSTWYLDFLREYPVMYRKSVGAAARSEMAEVAGEVSFMDADLSESEPLQTSISQNPTTIDIEVAEPYTIQSNGEQLTVQLKTYDIDATYEYHAVPKLDKDAFLIAKITGWDQYNLLNGETNLFFEGTYVGKSYLNPASVEDTLEISLGRDKSISVEREKIDVYSKSNFIGSNKVESRGFKIEVRNRKPVPIKITLFDQVPISTNSDIVVTPTEISNGNFQSQTGEITWAANINPGEQKIFELRYEVKYPRKEKVILE